MRCDPARGVGFALLALGVASGAQLRPVAVETPRRCTRIAYFSANRSEGELAVDYEPFKWSQDAEERFAALPEGQRWRFGEGFWILLDTQLDLQVAGVEVPSGYYYLVLEREGRDRWSLLALDPRNRRSMALPAGMEGEGIEIPLEWRRHQEPRSELAIELRPVEQDLRQATLEIQWGAHRLTAPIEVSLPAESVHR